jgi:hypothetical protein
MPVARLKKSYSKNQYPECISHSLTSGENEPITGFSLMKPTSQITLETEGR